MSCDKNPQKITQMFDGISSYYDKMNNFISLGTHHLIKKIAIKNLNIKPNTYILDLCCGSGDFTKIVNKLYPNAKIIGLDNSIEMLKIAKIKNPKQVFIPANCTSLPFNENEFDYITVGFGLRNIENRKQALSEIYRTLKSGGKFLHLDFGKHSFANKIFDLIIIVITKFAKAKYGANNKSFQESYNYLICSKNEYPEPDELIKEFISHGFKLLKRQDFLFGIISFQIMEKL